MDCLFCRIAAKQLPAKLLFENERLVAFEDLHPQAPTHLQIIPRKHIASSLEVGAEDHVLIGEMVALAGELARKRGFAEAGFRLVFNTNSAAGQTVYHIHLHLLGGRSFGWPPG